MKRIKLIRFARTTTETFGEFVGANGVPICCTLELPWKDNKRNVSCIPAGVYRCTRRMKNGKYIIDIHDVPNRDRIQSHLANKASELRGCIAPGQCRGMLDGENAVLSSFAAMQNLWRETEKEFELEIIERF